MARTLTDKDALRGIFPRTRRNKKELSAIIAYTLVAVASIVALIAVKHATQTYREQKWLRADGVVEDVRTTPAVQENSMYGGGYLYNVDVLARYPVDGLQRERWIRMEQQPRSLDGARFESRLWKGKRCVVRWDPYHLNRIVAQMP